MTTVSGMPSSNMYGYNGPATSAGSSTSPAKGTAGTAQPAASQAALESVLASFGNNSSSPLTYNAAGLLSAIQYATSATPGTATTSVQAAKDAVIAAENVVTDTLNTMLSTTSTDPSNSSSSDVSALFGLPATSNASDPFGFSQNPLLSAPANVPTTGGSAAQTAQNALIAAQNVVTNTLGSLEAGSSSNSSGSGA